MPDNRQVCGICGEIYGEDFAPLCSCVVFEPFSHIVPPTHLTVKKLKDVLYSLPDDYVVCMSADVPHGYVVGGTHYKVDQLSKSVFIIDITSQPEPGDIEF